MTTRAAICIRGDLRYWDSTFQIFFQIYDKLPYDVIDYYLCAYDTVTSAIRTISIPEDRPRVAPVEKANGNRSHPNTIVCTHQLNKERVLRSFTGKNLISSEFLSNETRLSPPKSRLIASQLYTMYRVNALKKQYEYENGFIYDLVINTRCDACIELHPIPYPTSYNDASRGKVMCRTRKAVEFAPLFGQDIAIYGGSLEVDVITGMFHNMPIFEKDMMDPHTLMAAAINKTRLLHQPVHHPVLFRKDGFNSILPDSNEHKHHMVRVDFDTWHGSNVTNRIGSATVVDSDTVIKNNYYPEKNDYVVVLDEQIEDHIKAYMTRYSDDVYGYDFDRLQEFAHTYANNLINWELHDIVRDKYMDGNNIVIRSSFSAEYVSLILHIMEISLYVSKIEFMHSFGGTPKVVMLDFDGVLVDSVGIHYQLLNLSLRELQLPEISFEDNEKIYDGLTTVQKLCIMNDKNLVPVEKNNDVIEIKRKLTAGYFSAVADIPVKIKETLMWLIVNHTVIITTNNDSSAVKAVLSKYPAFKNLQVVSKNDVPHPKPDKDMYVYAAAKFNTPPANCVVIDDCPKVITTAQSLGMQTILINNMYNDMMLDKIKERI